MSTDSSGAMPGHADAASDEHSPAAAVSPRALGDIAAAIGHVAALMETDAGQAPDGSDALERIADIAFVLHERDVEASLCDALDAAVRELARVGTGQRAGAQRLRQAADSLRELARRLDHLATPVPAKLRSEPAVASSDDTTRSAVASLVSGEHDDTVDDQMRREDLFAGDLREDDALTRGGGALAEALASFSEAAESGFDVERPATDIAAASGDPAKPYGAALLGDASSLPAVGDVEPADGNMSGAGPSADHEVQPLLEAKDTRTRAADPQPLPSPDEDPGDLFEPIRRAVSVEPSEPKGPGIALGVPPADFTKPAQAKLVDSELKDAIRATASAAAESAIAAYAGRANAGTLPTATRPPSMAAALLPPNDPLGPLLALSEEETIALFS